MKSRWLIPLWVVGAAAVAAAPAQENRGAAAGATADRPASTGPTADERARQRYDEMLAKMQSAIEEIAELYGSPSFLEVFTNDRERADDLKSRLAAVASAAAAQRELAELARRREELLNDLALREKESRRLTDKLTRQRAALEALAAAVEQARRATEESAR
jgi:DNA repair ATPase RecN